MKKCILCFSLLLLYVTQGYAVVPRNSPIGYWKTIDDITHTVKSVVEISMADDDSLQAKVVKLFPQPGRELNERCIACKGTRHNQPILGMMVMNGLHLKSSQPAEWSDGSIIDPSNGKVYHCYLIVSEDGQKLTLRGYVGIPLFGRTQTWLRVEDPERA